MTRQTLQPGTPGHHSVPPPRKPCAPIRSESTVLNIRKGNSFVKTAVVTGGASGIGLGIAERLRADGLHVATLDLNPATDDDFAYRADVSDPGQITAALADVREK